MTYPDGWKDEEADVDDFFKPNAEFKQVGDWVKVIAPPTSAQPCGCDAGANWVCERHQRGSE